VVDVGNAMGILKIGKYLRSLGRKQAKAMIAVFACVVALLGLGRVATSSAWFVRGGDIDHWQTLISGLVAILAALIGGGFVWLQVRASRTQENERMRRRHAAVRAVMPLTLSGLMEYARGCGRALRLLHLATHGESVREAQMRDFEIPSIPTDKIKALADIIEAGDDAVGEAIADLLSNLQVQDGRLRSTKAEVLDPHSHTRSVMKLAIEDFILDTADLYARCEGMLDYARRESESVKRQPTDQDLHRALLLMSFHEAAFDRVKATIERRHGQIVTPIEAADSLHLGSRPTASASSRT
jgi:hypothetical protein